MAAQAASSRSADGAPPFDNSYARLPDRFFARPDAAPVPSPTLIRLNRALADQLRLDPEFLASPAGVAMLAGNAFPETAAPIALAYAGHQFGQFVPQLGDGRALLVGEVVDRDGVRRDIQLKGSGPTPFSRNGDGRAALGPVLREYVVSEAMAALGIPTTRSLAAVTTGDWVYRETRLPGAVLTRVAASHLRIGTFQYFAARDDVEAIRTLADYAIDRHYPHLREAGDPYRGLLKAVIDAQAALVAHWMLVGFIHGVMNTDNMGISGETIDYGPCAFMDAYAPATVFSSIDRGGRYAYANQPHVAVWNLARLAETLLPLFGEDEDASIAMAEEALKGFQRSYADALTSGFRRKLGLLEGREDDFALVEGLLKVMADNGADFTRTFRGLLDDIDEEAGNGSTRGEFIDPTQFDAWEALWRDRLRHESGDDKARREVMRLSNPRFIPRNHRVEAMIEAAVERSDFQPFEELLKVLSRPFDDQPAFAHYADAPQEHEKVLATFCGT